MSGTKAKLTFEEWMEKFKEKNNRDPKNANELINFTKKFKDTCLPISYGEARKHLDKPDAQLNSVTTERILYEVGDKIVLTKDRYGTVRFAGEVKFAPGIWYGVELAEGFVGKCDGAREGERYFETGPQRAIFCQSSKIRRKMSSRDHERHKSWMDLSADRKARLAAFVNDDGKEAEASGPSLSVPGQAPTEKPKDQQQKPTSGKGAVTPTSTSKPGKETSSRKKGPETATTSKERDAPSRGGKSRSAKGNSPPAASGAKSVGAAASKIDTKATSARAGKTPDTESHGGSAKASPKDGKKPAVTPITRTPSASKATSPRKSGEAATKISVTSVDDAGDSDGPRIVDDDAVNNNNNGYQVTATAAPGDHILKFILSQGSVLQNDLFNIYTNPKTSPILVHSFDYIRTMNPDDQNEAVVQIVKRLKRFA